MKRNEVMKNEDIVQKMKYIQSDIKTEIIDVDSFNNKNNKETMKSDLLQKVDNFFKEK